ncbi:MAG: hypothetical protein AAF915_00745 [Cyanobacteria bacterium P01_D01_bin.50]
MKQKNELSHTASREGYSRINAQGVATSTLAGEILLEQVATVN